MLHSHCDFMGHKEVHTWNRSGVVGDGCHDGGGGGRGVPVWHAVPASTLPMPGPSLTGGGGGLNVPANTFSVPGPSLVVAVPAVPVPPGHVDVAPGHHDWHGIFYLQPCEVPGIVSVSVTCPCPQPPLPCQESFPFQSGSPFPCKPCQFALQCLCRPPAAQLCQSCEPCRPYPRFPCPFRRCPCPCQCPCLP